MEIYICYLPAGRSVLGKLCQRSWVRPEAAGRGPYPRPRAQFFPNTDRPRPANNLFIIFLRRVLCKQFLCWFFTAAIFKPDVRMRLTFRKMIAVVIWIHNCLFLIHYLHFTFFAVKKKKNAGKDAKAGKLVAVRTRGKSGPLERAQLANQIQGFRIPDRSDAWEKN